MSEKFTKEELKSILDKATNEIEELKTKKARLEANLDQYKTRIDEAAPQIEKKFGTLEVAKLQKKQASLVSELRAMFDDQQEPAETEDL